MVIANSKWYNEALILTKCLLNPIKNNTKLLFTVFTGVSTLTKANIFSGLNNFYHDSVVNSRLSKYFGFTEADIDSMLKKIIGLDHKLQEKEIKDSIAKWYKGYKITDQIIYNPWSIMNCFNSLSMEN